MRGQPFSNHKIEAINQKNGGNILSYIDVGEGLEMVSKGLTAG